mgnify:CR=1 FL=1
MIKFKIHFLLIFFLTLNFFYGCSKIRESAGVTRKSPDEFLVIENPPLVIPPDYSLIPPDQLQEKDIDNIEKELAEEILFGLEENNITEESQLSTMNQILLEANTGKVSDSIRDEIDKEFVKEMSANIFQFEWKDEKEVLDAVKESERIRKKNFNNESIAEGDIPTIKLKVKKKKKRFFIF